MSLKFLVTLLEWLQEQFIKSAEKQKAKATDLSARMQVLAEQRAAVLQEQKLADKLASKLDDLLNS